MSQNSTSIDEEKRDNVALTPAYHLQDEDHFIVDPTHWMPLPASPQS